MRNHFNGFPARRLNTFQRPTSQDFIPFQLAISGPGKPLKWFGIPMTLNPNLKVGENES